MVKKVCFSLIMAMSTLADMQPLMPAKVAVVDLEYVTKPFVDEIRAQVESILKVYQEEFMRYETALRQERQDLNEAQKKAPVSSEESQALALRQEELERRALDIQQQAEAKRKNLSDAHERVMGVLNQRLTEVIKAIGNERHIGLILPQSSAIYWNSALDISQEIKKRLEEGLKDKKELRVGVDD